MVVGHDVVAVDQLPAGGGQVDGEQRSSAPMPRRGWKPPAPRNAVRRTIAPHATKPRTLVPAPCAARRSGLAAMAAHAGSRRWSSFQSTRAAITGHSDSRRARAAARRRAPGAHHESSSQKRCSGVDRLDAHVAAGRAAVAVQRYDLHGRVGAPHARRRVIARALIDHDHARALGNSSRRASVCSNSSTRSRVMITTATRPATSGAAAASSPPPRTCVTAARLSSTENAHDNRNTNPPRRRSDAETASVDVPGGSTCASRTGAPRRLTQNRSPPRHGWTGYGRGPDERAARSDSPTPGDEAAPAGYQQDARGMFSAWRGHERRHVCDQLWSHRSVGREPVAATVLPATCLPLISRPRMQVSRTALCPGPPPPTELSGFASVARSHRARNGGAKLYRNDVRSGLFSGRPARLGRAAIGLPGGGNVAHFGEAWGRHQPLSPRPGRSRGAVQGCQCSACRRRQRAVRLRTARVRWLQSIDLCM